jgi:predicted dithiol-disulfide oxidoreductase (DUF899 family)
MIQRWKMSPNQSMVTDPDGDWVEYSDHLAAISMKDKEIERLKKDSDRYRKLRRMHCNEFQNIYVASLNGNRSFDELVDGIQTILLDDNMIDDGFGNSWSKTCPMCHMQTMQIVRPGKAQCSICG